MDLRLRWAENTEANNSSVASQTPLAEEAREEVGAPGRNGTVRFSQFKLSSNVVDRANP